MQQKSSDLAVSQCIRYVQTNQRPDGSLESLSGNKDFEGAVARNPTFITSLALVALSRVRKSALTKEITENGAAFLMTNRSKSWSWNYWPREAEETETKPYPDDLDDTALAIAALTPHLSAKNSAAALAAFTKLLISTEEKPGGPYGTWLVSPSMKEAWKDTDPAVNANIAYCLKLHGVELPGLHEYLEHAISNADYASKYYDTPYLVLYAISRAYGGRLKVKACEYLLSLRCEDGLWGNLMDTSLAVTALLNWGTCPSLVTSAILHLVKAAYGNAWKAEALYVEEERDAKVWCGSAALTAAFAAEALSLYATAREPERTARKGTGELPKAAAILRAEILARAKDHLSRCPHGLRGAARLALGSMDAKDPDGHISLLPYFWNEAVKGSGKVERKLLIELGALNLMGWVAYRIYDDILDDEGDPGLLPVANLLLREVTSTYQKLLPKSEFILFTKIMDALEEANRWEREHCRLIEKDGSLFLGKFPGYGSYGVLAEKSLGHAMGPVMILSRLGYGRDSRHSASALAFFRHYLVARQLNDDAHDWVRDLERGFMNPAAARTVRDWSAKGTGRGAHPDLASVLPDLQNTFWRQSIVGVAEDILNHAKKARESLAANRAVKDSGYFERLLEPLEEAARKALKERKETIEFLRYYR